MTKNSAGIIQAMPLLEGKVNLTTGLHDVVELIHCVADGTVEVEWSTGTVANIGMLAGQDYAFTGSVNVISGTYHIS